MDNTRTKNSFLKWRIKFTMKHVWSVYKDVKTTIYIHKSDNMVVNERKYPDKNHLKNLKAWLREDSVPPFKIPDLKQLSAILRRITVWLKK